MPKIYGYLVGIGDYPDPEARLNGPENDVAHIREFLKAFVKSTAKTELAVHQLLHNEAKRDDMIDGFKFLANAGPEDFVVFFYSGHGSQMKVGPVFWDDPGEYQESFVCHDSRTNGGLDLMDKEVAYLLHKHTHQSKPHAIAIIDSCHSGGVLRDLNVVTRMQAPSQQVRTLESYHDYQHYTADGQGKYSVPKADILLLAACEPDQLSKETTLQGLSSTETSVQGIFTNALISTLVNNANHLSYANLMNKVALQVDERSINQTPFLTSFGDRSHMANRYFLDGKLTFSPTRLLVQKDQYDDYYLNAGRLHGIDKDDKLLLFGTTPLTIVEVGAHTTTVRGVPGVELSYEVTRIPNISRKMKVGWHTTHDANAKTVLQKQLDQNPKFKIHILPDREGADYILRAEDGHYFITRIGVVENEEEVMPVFRRIKGFTDENALVFLNHLDQLANYQQVLNLRNDQTGIGDEHVEIDVFVITDPGNTDSDAPREKVPDIFAGVDLHYARKNNKWHLPAFQLCVRNLSEQTLWIAGLYMGPDRDLDTGNTTLFTITDVLMPDQQVPKKNGKAWMQYSGVRTLPFEILDDQFDNGAVTQIECVLKILVSTKKIFSSAFNQPGVLMEPAIKRSTKGVRDIQSDDWRTYEIRMRVHRPAEAIDIQ